MYHTCSHFNQSLYIAAYKSIVHCCSRSVVNRGLATCEGSVTTTTGTGTNKHWPKVKLNLCHSTFCHPLLGKEPFRRSSCVQAENAGMVNKQRHIICEVFVLWSATSHHLPVHVCARPVSEKVFNVLCGHAAWRRTARQSLCLHRFLSVFEASTVKQQLLMDFYRLGDYYCMMWLDSPNLQGNVHDRKSEMLMEHEGSTLLSQVLAFGSMQPLKLPTEAVSLGH